MLDDGAAPSNVLDRLRTAWPYRQVSYTAGVLILAPFEPLMALHVHLPLERIDAMCRPAGSTLEVLWPDSSPEVAGAFWFATQLLDALRHPHKGGGPLHVLTHEGRLLVVRDPEDADEWARALEPAAPLSRGQLTQGRRLRAYAPGSEPGPSLTAPIPRATPVAVDGPQLGRGSDLATANEPVLALRATVSVEHWLPVTPQRVTGGANHRLLRAHV